MLSDNAGSIAYATSVVRYTDVPPKFHRGASQVTLMCLLRYISVPPKLYWGASQVTLVCIPSYTDVQSFQSLVWATDFTWVVTHH